MKLLLVDCSMPYENPSRRFLDSTKIKERLLEKHYEQVDLIHIESIDQMGYLLHKTDKSYDEICVLNPVGTRVATNAKAFKQSLYGRSLRYVDKVVFKNLNHMLREV